MLVFEDEKVIFVLHFMSPKQLRSLERNLDTDNQSFHWILGVVGKNNTKQRGL